MLLRELKSGMIRVSLDKVFADGSLDNILDFIDLVRNWIVDGLRYYYSQKEEISDEEAEPDKIPE